MLRDVLKAPGYGRTKPGPARAIFVSDPTKIDSLALAPDVRIVDGSGSDVYRDLRDFLEGLEGTSEPPA